MPIGVSQDAEAILLLVTAWRMGDLVLEKRRQTGSFESNTTQGMMFSYLCTWAGTRTRIDRTVMGEVWRDRGDGTAI